MCSASSTGLSCLGGQALRGEDRLLGLLGVSVELHGLGPLVNTVSAGPRSGTRVSRVRLLDVVDERSRELPASSSRPDRQHDARACTYRSPRCSDLKRGRPWPDRRNVRPFCVSGGMRSITRPADGLHRDFCAEQRLSERDRQLAGQVRPLAGEDRMGQRP